MDFAVEGESVDFVEAAAVELLVVGGGVLLYITYGGTCALT